MLNEIDRRVLNAVFPDFAESFDSHEAAIFMEMSCIFSPDEARKIEDKKSSLPALREFYRIYSRKADNLCHLENYLKRQLQYNLIASLNNVRCYKDSFDDNRCRIRRHISREERHRIMVKGQVPFPRKFVNRSFNVGRIAESLRSKEEFDHGFFVVLHGLAGVGKSALASYVLAETDLIGTHFDNVCFLTDSRNNTKDVKILFYDLLVMLRDDLISPPPIDISETTLRKLIIDALFDHPNLLVVIDDVTSIETVQEAERLGLRVLATTRDRAIFDAVENVDVLTIDGFRLEETKDYMSKCGIKSEEGCFKASIAVSRAHEVTSGNPALLGKMAKLARGSHSTLSNLANMIASNGISCIECTSSYRFKNLHGTFSDSVQKLLEIEMNALACAVALPPDQWIPIEVWELIIPIDVCETGNVHDELRKLLRMLHDNGGWIAESPDREAYKISAIVSNYLKETVDKDTVKECYSCLEASFNSFRANSSSRDERQDALTAFFNTNSTFYSRSK